MGTCVCWKGSAPAKASLRTQAASERSAAMDTERAPSHEALQVLEAARRRLPGGRMSAWQKAWCTDRNLGVFVRARQGDVEAAAGILAAALQWRERYREVLAGERLPEWVTDMRVLTRGQAGHPVVYTCARFSQRGARPECQIEHMAAVFEAAVLAMRQEATQFVVVLDLHGFQLADHLDPRPAFAMAEMAKNPYRERLGLGIIVDAPWAFSSIWRVASPLIPERTAKKIRFVSADEAVAQVASVAGEDAAKAVARVISRNRTEQLSWPARLPSEVEVDQGGTDGAGAPPEGLAAARGASGPLEEALCEAWRYGRPRALAPCSAPASCWP